MIFTNDGLPLVTRARLVPPSRGVDEHRAHSSAVRPGEGDQRRTVLGRRARVVDHDVAARGEQFVDDALLPGLATTRVRPVVLAHHGMGGGEMLPHPRGLAGALQADDHDELHRGPGTPRAATVGACAA